MCARCLAYLVISSKFMSDKEFFSLDQVGGCVCTLILRLLVRYAHTPSSIECTFAGASASICFRVLLWRPGAVGVVGAMFDSFLVRPLRGGYCSYDRISSIDCVGKGNEFSFFLGCRLQYLLELMRTCNSELPLATDAPTGLISLRRRLHQHTPHR